MKKYFYSILLFAFACVTYSNAQTATSLFSEDFKNTDADWLQVDGWKFDRTPSFAAKRLQPEFGYFAIPTIKTTSAFNSTYSQVWLEVSYRIKKSNNTENGILFYIDDNNNLSIEPIKKIGESYSDDNKWKTLIYKLDENEMNLQSVDFKFFVTNLSPTVEIKEISVFANPLDGSLQSNFTAENTFLSNTDTLVLTDLSVGNPTKWLWTIQDSYDQNKFVEFTTPDISYPLSNVANGLYDVTLEVSDNEAKSSLTKTRYIAVGCPETVLNNNKGHFSEITFSQNNQPLFTVDETTLSSSGSIINLSDEFSLDASDSITLDITIDNLSDDLLENPLLYMWFGYYNDVSDFANDKTLIPLTVDTENKKASATYTFITEATSTPGNFLLRLKLASDTTGVEDACSAIETGDVATFALNCTHNHITTFLGNAIQFTGKGYLKTSTENRFVKEPINEFCFEGWSKRSTTNDFIFIAQGNESENNETQYSFNLAFVKGHIVLYYEDELFIESHDHSYIEESWAHIAIVGDGNYIKLYVNGEEIASVEKAAPYFKNAANDNYSQIGSNNFIGSLEGTRLWSVARNEQEIREGWYHIVDEETNGLISYYQYNYASLKDASVVHDWHGYKHMNIIGELSVEKSFAPFLFSPETPTKSTTTQVANIFDPANWSWHPTEMPNRNSKAVIDHNTKMIIETDGTEPAIGAMELTPGSQLTIEEGSRLNIQDSIIYRYTHDEPASFLGNDKLMNKELDVWVDATYTSGRNWYLGVLANNITFKNLGGELWDGNNTASSTYFASEWDANIGWVYIKDENTPIEPLKGYLISAKPGEMSRLRYKGRVTSESYQEISLKGKGWHLVSNPFWAYLDLNELACGNHPGSANFQDGSDNELPTFSSQFTVWTTLDDGERYYAKYNATEGVVTGIPFSEWNEALIAPAQAFFIYSNKDTATFRIDRTMLRQPEGDNPRYKSAKYTEPIRVYASNQYGSYDCAVVSHYDGQNLYSHMDTEYKKVSDKGSIPLIYSIKANSEGKNDSLSINVLPEEEETLIIPIALDINENSSGIVELSFSGIDQSLYDAYFEIDHIEHKITDDSTFSINTTAYQTKKYYLKLSKLSNSTGYQPTQQHKYIVFAKNNQVTVRTDAPLDDSYTVNIISSAGKKLAGLKPNSNSTNFYLRNPGLYLIQITDDSVEEIHKIVIP